MVLAEFLDAMGELAFVVVLAEPCLQVVAAQLILEFYVHADCLHLLLLFFKQRFQHRVVLRFSKSDHHIYNIIPIQSNTIALLL